MRQLSIQGLIGLIVMFLMAACATVPPPTIQQAPTPTEPPTATPSPQPTAPPTATPQPAAQDESDFAGRWTGTLDVQGTELDVTVNLVADGDGLAGTIDVPAQGATGVELDNVRAEGNQLSFELSAGSNVAAFSGERTADDTIVGELEQAGVQMALTLERGAAEAAAEPTEPVPYEVEDVTFENGDVTLAGTLTLPDRQGPHPAVVLISGSGPQNRDEEIASIPDYEPFQVIADHLTRHGIAVLRYDDRGVGESTGNHWTATSADFAADAEAGLAFLRRRAEIDPEQVGLLGHSEGGIIAPMIAARNPNVAFIISLAGTAVPGYDVLLVQNERILRASGATEQEVEAGIAEARRSMDLNLAGDWEALEDLAYETGRRELEALSEEERQALGDADTYLENQIRQAMPFWRTWMHFFLTHDPAADWAEVEVPVLALFGELDTQVDVGQNKPALEAALDEAGNDDATVVVFPDANHLFLAADTGGPDEYAELDKAFVPGFLDTISDWLLARVDAAAEQDATLSRDEKWQANLDFLVRALPQYHIDPFFKVSQESFEEAAAKLRSQIPDLTDEEVVVRLSQLVAMLGDEHTALSWTGEQPSLYFPINFQVFSDGIYVVATTPDYADALSNRLVSIAGTEAEAVMDRLASIIPHTNEQWVNVQAMARINSVDLLLGLKVIPQTL